MSLINDHYTLMRCRKARKKTDNPLFKVFPHAICESRKIKKVIHRLKDRNVILSDSTRNSKINLITTRKTITPREKLGNLLLSSKCHCGLKTKMDTTRFNENGGMAIQRLTSDHSDCLNDLHAFRDFKLTRGLAYRGQTKIFARYMAWMNRNSTHELGFPNHYFTPFIERNFEEEHRTEQLNTP